MTEDIVKTVLTLADIQSVIGLIEVCNKRSAFRVDELETVGKLYNHFKKFITENLPPTEEATPMDTTKDTTETTETKDTKDTKDTTGPVEGCIPKSHLEQVNNTENKNV
jgi:hypothetical protein